MSNIQRLATTVHELLATAQVIPAIDRVVSSPLVMTGFDACLSLLMEALSALPTRTEETEPGEGILRALIAGGDQRQKENRGNGRDNGRKREITERIVDLTPHEITPASLFCEASVHWGAGGVKGALSLLPHGC